MPHFFHLLLIWVIEKVSDEKFGEIFFTIHFQNITNLIVRKVSENILMDGERPKFLSFRNVK